MLTWDPGQILIGPVQSHPAIHLVQLALIVNNPLLIILDQIFLGIFGRMFCNFEPNLRRQRTDLKKRKLLIEVKVNQRHPQVDPHRLRVVQHLRGKLLLNQD